MESNLEITFKKKPVANLPKPPHDLTALSKYVYGHMLEHLLESNLLDAIAPYMKHHSSVFANRNMQRWEDSTIKDALDPKWRAVNRRLIGITHEFDHAVRSYIFNMANLLREEKIRAERWTLGLHDKTVRDYSATLKMLLKQISLHKESTEPVIFSSTELLFKRNSSLLELSFSNSEHNWYSITTQLGIWSGSPENLSLHCSCAGSFHEQAICSHMRVILQWTLDILHDPTEQAHEQLIEVLERPNWKFAIESASWTIENAIEYSKKQAEISQNNERFSWRIAQTPNDKLEVMPIIQKRSASGAWSKGRRLNSRRDSLGDLNASAAERTILRNYMPEDNRYYNTEIPEAGEVLCALVGNSRVYLNDKKMTRVLVRKGHVSLAVLPDPEGFRLTVRFDDKNHNLFTIGVHGRMRSLAMLNSDKDICTATTFSTSFAEFVNVLKNFPPTMPMSSRTMLFELFEKAQSEIDVWVHPSLRSSTVDTVSRLIVRLEPGEEISLTVKLRVRIASQSELSCPGDGKQEVIVANKDSVVIHRRDLSQEIDEANRVAEYLKLAEGKTAWTWSMDTPEETLSLIRRAQELDDKVDVEWPRDDKWVVRKGRTDSFKVDIRRKTDWFNIGGHVEVDGVKVTIAQMITAARQGQRYVRLKGNRFVMLEQRLMDKVDSLSLVASSQSARGLTVSKSAALALNEELETLPNVSADRSWLEQISKIKDAANYTPKIPKEMNATLRDYQIEGFTWMARLASWESGCCLADDMGLGKTLQALALLLLRKKDGPALVVAPMSVTGNWITEARRFAPTLDFRLYHGSARADLLSDLGPGVVLVASYNIVSIDADKLTEIKFATMIIDEAQFIKNAATRRAKAIIAIPATVRCALTGTPLENHLGELWSIFNVVTPGLLGSFNHFKKHMALPIERSSSMEAKAALTALLRPFILRRTKAMVAPELPSRTETISLIELSEDHRVRYEAARREILNELLKTAAGDNTQRFKALAALTRLRRLACHPRLVDEYYQGSSGKTDRALELINSLRKSNQRALIFSQFTSHLAILREELDSRGISYLYLDGSTPGSVRTDLVQRWSAKSESFFLISLKAGGTGLNLSGANYVIHMDPWWNPAAEDQATDRTHRIGQIDPVTVVRLISAGTVEEAVIALHKIKRELAQDILDGTHSTAKLSPRELVDLIRQGESAEQLDVPLQSTKEDASDKEEQSMQDSQATPTQIAHTTLNAQHMRPTDLAALYWLVCMHINKLRSSKVIKNKEYADELKFTTRQIVSRATQILHKRQVQKLSFKAIIQMYSKEATRSKIIRHALNLMEDILKVEKAKHQTEE